MSSTAITDPSAAKAKLEEARKMVTECDKEMQMLKRKIRELGTDGGDPNSLELVVLNVRIHSFCVLRLLRPKMYRYSHSMLLYYNRLRDYRKEQSQAFHYSCHPPLRNNSFPKSLIPSTKQQRVRWPSFRESKRPMLPSP
jgi:hypothetical protein